MKYAAIYKCKLCGNLFEENHEFPNYESNVSWPPPGSNLLDHAHRCQDGARGVGEFVGDREVKE